LVALSESSHPDVPHSNATSLSTVEDAFHDVEDDNNIDALSSKDDSLDIQVAEGREDALRWLKDELVRQVGKYIIDTRTTHTDIFNYRQISGQVRL